MLSPAKSLGAINPSIVVDRRRSCGAYYLFRFLHVKFAALFVSPEPL
jgi:hypothetical protein